VPAAILAQVLGPPAELRFHHALCVHQLHRSRPARLACWRSRWGGAKSHGVPLFAFHAVPASLLAVSYSSGFIWKKLDRSGPACQCAFRFRASMLLVLRPQPLRSSAICAPRGSRLRFSAHRLAIVYRGFLVVRSRRAVIPRSIVRSLSGLCQVSPHPVGGACGLIKETYPLAWRLAASFVCERR